MAGLDVITDIENCYAGGWSDGLPVIPPYDSLVTPMLKAMDFDRTEIVGTIKAQSVDVRGEHLAAAAVMAGCEERYGPVLRAISLALLDPLFNLSGTQVTTGGTSALVIVSGDIAERLGFEDSANALGASARPNATVGRFAQLVRMFCGSGGGALQAHGTVGHPGRISFCIAEHPETVWPDFHTQYGHEPSTSAVSVHATEGPNSVNNHFAESGEAVLETIASTLAHLGTTNIYYRHAPYTIVVAPDHMDLISAEFDREGAKQFLFERARQPTDELIRLGRIPEQPRSDLDVRPGMMRPPVRTPDKLHFIEAGSPGGKFSAVIPHWVGDRHNISRVVEW